MFNKLAGNFTSININKCFIYNADLKVAQSSADACSHQPLEVPDVKHTGGTFILI